MNLYITFVDFLVVAVILISTCYAAYRGFLNETLTIVAWAAAAFATLYFGPWLVPMARSMITTGWLAEVAAYAGVFLVVFIPLSFMSHRFSQSVKNSPIGPLDRALGIAFGVVRGLVVVGICYIAFTKFEPPSEQPRWMTSARTYPIIQTTALTLLAAMPNQAPRDDITAEPTHGDSLGALIRRQNEEAAASSESHDSAKKREKTYGATDRQALDKLFETTGGSGRP
jgi:membrane protein required for colicin V production